MVLSLRFFGGFCWPRRGLKVAVAWLLVLGVLAGMVAGCRSVKSVDESAAVGLAPTEWMRAQEWPQGSVEEDLRRWWRSFGDERLVVLVETALERNPDVGSAAAAVREARAQRRGLQAQLWPSVNGSAGAGRSDSWASGSHGEGGESYSLGLDTAWETDLFGQRRSQIAAGTARVEASEANLDAVRVALAAETALAYVNLRAAEQQVATIERSLELRQESWQLAQWRQQSQMIDGLEASQALSSLEQARASLPQVRQTAEQARNLLSRLTGSVPGTADGVVAQGTAKIPVPQRRLAVGIPATALARRPDVRQAAWNWSAALAETEAARAQRWPSLNLSGTFGLDGDSAGSLVEPQTAALNLAARLTGPIFDAGRIRSQIEGQEAAQEGAMLAYRQVALLALSEVEDALIACRRTEERIVRLAAATEAARDAAQLARMQYESGQIDFTTVLDTQRTLLDLEQSQVSAQADRTTAFIGLYRALGGGWGD